MDGRKKKITRDEEIDESNYIIQQFQKYQKELDSRHDKHERLVKLSRDITIESKRVIFFMQRSSSKNLEMLEQALKKIQDIQQQKFLPMAKELQGEEPHQFLRAYTAGLQEYIEAVAFYHYLRSKTLVSLNEVQVDLTFAVPSSDTENSQEKTICVYVPPSEYMLGLADLTGELMRFAINSVGSGDMDTPNEVCAYLHKMLGGFQSLGQVSREMNRKISTLRQSLQKVEAACYTLQIRGSEIPKHMLQDVFKSVQETSYLEERDLDD
ncbi:translin-associated protein X-like isoform X2 [Ostrea edulis]|uniref:translin-associated protein X-like isoform X2 n=1 Tax=Ostrea edulis TaxID=37623 RepID=UPI0020942BB0|nr:translin-associated protein X-like isoform X2 [Ostrea edulis]